MKLYLVLVILSMLLGGCFLFFYPGEYEDLLSSLDNRRNSRSGGSSGGLILESGVYVSPNGSDANDGLAKTRPVKSIQKAISVAVSNNLKYIYLSVGVYSPGSGLNTNTSGVVITNNNIRIIGGLNENFSSIIGYSELDGGNSLNHVVFSTNVSNIVLMNLVIRGGNANGNYPHDRGGGIYLGMVSYSLISNVVVSSNQAIRGGGIHLYGNNNIISSSIYGNSANQEGGGIYMYSSYDNTISGSVYGNSASQHGGGIYIYYSHNNTINGSIYGNSANIDGGGIYLTYSSGNTISGSMYVNIANNGGGGICLKNSSNNTIVGSVYSNRASNGGGIDLGSSYNNTISGSVYGNSASSGGGIYIYESSGISILNSYITNNWSTNSNIVIFLEKENDLADLVISNCVIGGNNDTDAIGIYESDGDITGHKLLNNRFITNRLKYLYKEFTDDRLITNNIDWININNPNLLDTTPDSTNNIAI